MYPHEVLTLQTVSSPPHLQGEEAPGSHLLYSLHFTKETEALEETGLAGGLRPGRGQVGALVYGFPA